MSVTEHLWTRGSHWKASFEQMIAAQRKRSPVSALGAQTAGWSSAKDAHVWPFDCMEELSGYVLDLFGEKISAHRFQIDAWCIVVPPGGLILPHDHHQAMLSAIYYPRGSGGALCFADGSRFLPATGRLLMFPGELEHWTTTNPGPRDRMSIAFNAYAN